MEMVSGSWTTTIKVADGRTLAKAIENAKKYLTGALASGLDLGHGSGPLEHTYAL